MSRTEKSIKNIIFSFTCQVLGILAAFFTRKVFVLVLTQDYLGLDGTFSNILTMLSVADLGIAAAITYSLYKPLAEDDRTQIVAIITLFKRVYRIIGVVVALLGCAVAPFLPVLVRDLPDLPHIYLIYLLFVLNTSLTYFYVHKQSLITADQRQYVVSTCHYVLKVVLYLLQALFLWLTRNYFVYLGLQIATTLAENLILSYWSHRLYPYLRTTAHSPLNPEVKQGILRNTKALLAHKIGTVVIFGTDNLLISYFIGAIAVGLYSNYLMVTNGLQSLYTTLFRSLTASVGNLGVTEDEKRALPVFHRICFAGSWLYGFSAVCLVVLFNPFITLWVGPDYLFDQEIVLLIALNFYVTGMRQATQTFREAYGLYWYDRWKPIFESLINLTVSAALAVPFGITGIFIGTFVSTMTTCFWVEPWVLFKHGFKAPVAPYFRNYVIHTLITAGNVWIVWQLCTLLPGSGFGLFLEKCAVCVVVGNLIFLLVYHRSSEFRYFWDLLKRLLKKLSTRFLH